MHIIITNQKLSVTGTGVWRLRLLLGGLACCLLALCFNGVSCQSVAQSKCSIKVLDQIILDPLKIDGTWYELERSSLLVEFPLKCISVSIQQFYDNQANFNLKAFNRILKKKVNENGILSLFHDFPHSGKLNQTILPPKPHSLGLENHTLQVLDTDYDHYLILWGCRDFQSNSHSEALWILGRRPHPILNISLAEKISESLRIYGLSHIKLEVSPRKNCKGGNASPSGQRRSGPGGRRSRGNSTSNKLPGWISTLLMQT